MEGTAKGLLLFALGFGLAFALYFVWKRIQEDGHKSSLTVIDGGVPKAPNTFAPASVS